MANNKLLGTLELNSGNVLKTIDQVNAALKNLGKDVDLNLTNILNTKVNSQLQELKKQIDEVSQSARKMTQSQSNMVSSAAQMTKQILDLERSMMSRGATEAQIQQLDRLKARYQELTKGFSSEMMDAVNATQSVENALMRLNDASERATKKYAENMVKTMEAHAKEVEKINASAVKAEQQRVTEQAKAEAKAATTEYEKAVQQRIEVLRAQYARDSATKGTKEYDFLNSEYKKLYEGYSHVSSTIRKQVSEDARVLAEQQKHAYNEGLKAAKESDEKREQSAKDSFQRQVDYRKTQLKEQIEAEKSSDDAMKAYHEEQAKAVGAGKSYNALSKATKEQIEQQKEVIDLTKQLNTIREQNAVKEQAKKEAEAYSQALDLRSKMLNTEKQLQNANIGDNERSALQNQLDKDTQAYNQYSDAIKNKVEADEKIVEAKEQLTVAQARSQDKALKDQQRAQEEAAKKAEEEEKRLQEYRNRWRDYAVSAIGAISIAVLKEQWTAAINYATQYYDAQNEIRMVTEMSEADAMKMGQNMRDLAEEMKVTSTDLSKAAITFYRQGLNDAEVQKRLKWVTEYAKVANVDFNEAAQLMTAAVNTMGSSIEESGVEDAVQRIADVWLYLGDNAATSGKEIGIAMQKASASAKEFGLSFEWLGTYIAVVSEQTRQAPEVIGTAFNSMLARMHQIKLSGFNSEDATKVNDVAKALATLNIELFDGEGKWRDMNLIYEDVAAQWGDMDAKQRALLATTMAGTRQQNVFYALMNDMSKGIEGGSRAWELYEGAMNSAGTASRKYAIYQESIAASQADMKNSLEQLYSNLQPGVIKGFYDIITLIVDGLNNMSVAIPLVIAGITALGVTIKAITASMNPFVAIMAVAASVLGALIGTGGLGALFGGLKGKSFSDFTKEIAESTDKIASLQSAQSGIEEMLAKVQSGATLTTGEIKKYTSALNTIATVSPSAEKAVRELTSGLGDQATALGTLSESAQKAIEDLLQVRQIAAERALADFTDSEEYKGASRYSRKDFESYRSSLRASLSPDAWSDVDIIERALLQYKDLADYVYNTYIGDVDDLGELETAIDNYFTRYASQLTNAIKGQAQVAVDNIINALGVSVSSTQQEYLGETIIDMLMGDDGTLDYEDVAERRIREIRGDLIKGASAALSDGEQYRRWLLNKLSGYTQQKTSDLEKTLTMAGEGEAPTEILEDIMKLSSAGVNALNVMTALSESSSWDEFANKLKGIKEVAQDTANAFGGEDGGEDNLSNTIKKYVDNITKASKAIDKIKSVQESLDKSGTFSLSDVLDIAETNPEILSLVKNIDLQKDKLSELRNASNASIKENVKQLLLSGDNNIAGTPFSSYASAGITSLSGVREWQEKGGFVDQLKTFDDWVDKTADAFIKLTTETSVAADSFQTFLTNIDNLNKAKDALEVITKPLDNDPTKVASAWKTLLEIFTELNPETSGVDDVKAAVDGLDESTRSAAQGFGELGRAILDSMNKTEDAIKEAAEAIRTSFEDSKAATEGYQAQVDQLSEALSSGGVGNALTTWEGFSKAIREGIQEQFPNLITALADAKKASEEYGDGTEEAEKALSGLEHELRNVTKNNAVRYFNNTVKAIDGLNKGTMKASDAYVDFNKEAKKAITAQSEFNTANLNFTKGVEVSASDVKNLASYLGDLDPEWVLDNWEQVGPMLSAALAEGQEAFDRLNEAAFINITGTSSADFSAIMDGLIMVEDEANAAVQALMATGQWKIEERDLEQNAPVWIPGRFGGGRWDTVSATGKYKILVPTGTSPFAKRGGGSSSTSGQTSGGGGGGGGGKKNAGPSEVEIMLDRMEQIQGLQNHSRSLYQAQAGYYSQTGELQGVIKYYQKEIEAIKEQNVTLEENVAELDTWIQKKKAEVDSLDKGTDEYSTAADELKDLQERHQEYTLQLMENTTEVDKLTKAIKEQNKAIRDMEIDLRNTILQAIQDREELNDRMTQGEVDTQNTILELIKKRYEAERDLILENADKQIDSLQKERDLLDEQLQLRKQQAEEEDKAIRLAELEAKYAQISTDPTRQKEALSIQKDIKNLRDEIAWDMAEKEVKAQQDRLDQQVTSLEDYKTYVEEYYEDLFEHPKKLIAEMKEIIKGTDEEIIAWLVANDMVYAEATDAVKQQTMKSWEEMLRNMRGGILTYWDEVEEVIAGGDDNIIAFLKENSADYREAGKLQAEAYVEEWLDKLEKLRLAYKQVSGEIAPYDYSYVEPGTGSGSGGGGGGGGSGGSSQSKKTEGTAHGYTFTFDGKVYRNTGYASSNAAANAAQAAFSTLTSQASQHLYQTQGVANAKKMIDAWASSIKAYKLGGMAYDTGLAWIDGTPGRPERILSGYQTELFESLVRSMEAIGKISVSSMPYLNDDLMGNTGNTVSVGDIIVNVDRMETDADYESMADRVLNAIVEKLNRGSVVGGIRFSR